MKRLLLAGALFVALLASASPALAAPYHPTGEFADFNDCPLSHPTLAACLYTKSTSGTFTLGKKTVPVKNPVILQGGLEINPGFEAEFVGAEDGNTLPKVPQPVPGGLTGVVAPSWWPQFLRDLFNETINNGFTGVTSTVELAGPASAIKVDQYAMTSREGPALILPVKIKLDNPFLGSNCYIGSNSKPVLIKFTTGATSPPPPNVPISGTPGNLFLNPGGTLFGFKENRLVDNSFAAPGTTGCGGLFSFLVDPFVSSIVGVPSPTGANTAILEGELKLAQPAAVKASE